MRNLAALRHAVAIGLCLAMPALAQAQGGVTSHTAAQQAAHIQALETSLSNRAALQGYLANPNSSTLHATLAEHHAAVAGLPAVEVVTHDGVTLHVQDGHLHVREAVSGRRWPISSASG